MALITCTKCGKRFSNQSPACPECRQEWCATDSAEVKKTALRDFRTQIYRLNMISYLALTICTAGFIWFWSASRHARDVGAVPWGMIGVGAGGYLIIRLLMIRAKLKYRKITRN